jgi:ubiquinone/menaquinone biosynthesis C-methylase UbiE
MTIELHQAHVRYSAEEYDRFTATFTRQFDAALAGIILPHAITRGPDAVLIDIGTGTGRFLLHLATIPALAGLRLIGTDLFPDMITRARTAADDAGVTIQFLCQDVHQMELPDASADIITSRSTVHHWQDPVQAFREIYRLLKPRGVAFICDIRRDAPADVVAEFNRLRAEAGLGPSVLEEKYTKAELEEFCRVAGIDGHCRLYAGGEGLAALGITLMMKKPAARR